jgi:peptide/nickel transport system permease protein
VARYGFVVKRLIIAMPLLAGVVLLVFLLMKVVPGDPARVALGPRASQQQVLAAQRQMGLDRPVLSQYWLYLWRAVHGNLGFSYKTQQPVAGNILARAPVTLWLIGAGIVFSLLISVPLAVLAASRRDGLADHVVRLVSALGIGMPMFWVGIMLVALVALPTGWFPVGGFGTTLAGHLRSMVLPGLTLGIAMAPPMIRGLRASIVDVLGSDYVSFGRSLGTTGLRMQRRFVLRNALPPVVTLLAVQSGYFLFGAVVLETAFALPGMGEGMVLAAVNRDLPLVQGYTLLFALAVVLVYLVADVVNVLLDPRVAIRA